MNAPFSILSHTEGPKELPGNWSRQLMGITAGRYRYLQDLLHLESSSCGSIPHLWSRGPTPLSVQAFARHLQSHPDQQFSAFILRGLSYGFRVGYSSSRGALRSRGVNHPSSLANQAVVGSYIADEVKVGRLVGPILYSFRGFVHTSPIGLVPKGHASGKWRMIVDLSSPRAASVNSGIDEALCSLRYASLDNAIELIRHLGPGTELLKMDLKDAYRVVPVHPDDYHLLGITWNGHTYVDRSLPFGLRSAPKLFTAVADAMAWALHFSGIQYLLHYLDDFLFIGHPYSGEAAQAQSIATSVFQELGVPVAEHKTEGPAAQVIFLGFQINTLTGQLSLPRDKLMRLKALVREWCGRTSCTRRELESLLGHLSHAATAVRPGRLYLRQMFALLPTASRPFFFVRLKAPVRADLAWWLFFLEKWNGVSIYTKRPVSVNVYSDASGSFGCGAFVSNGAWFSVRWPHWWQSVDISAKELLPVVLAAACWGHIWSGHHIRFNVDNIAVVKVVNRLNADSPHLCQLLRCLQFYSVYYKFTFSTEHIPGTNNTAADALSRGNISLFRSLFPQVPQYLIPPPLLNVMLAQMPDWSSASWMIQFKASLRPASHPIP